MFDILTRSLITSVPPLAGLDVEALPEDLTRYFVEITTARLSLAAGSDDDRSDLKERLDRLRRLSHTYAAYVAANVTPDHSRAAAFVAATGFRLLAEADTLSLETPALRDRLAPEVVSPWLLAIVLFLIAESPADAYSAVTAMRDHDSPGESDAATILRTTIAGFAEGRLQRVLDIAADNPGRRTASLEEGADPLDEAVDRLWLRLSEGLAGLAAQLLYSNPASVNVEQNPAAAFGQVRELAYRTIAVELPSFDNAEESVERQITSAFAGPHLLASLLLRLGDDFLRRGLVRTPVPPNTDPSAWRDAVQELARNRPFLWTNHLEAISQGYLNPGTSSAISFPTGAGKSTLAELKIMTHLIAGNKIVFAAPTHALVNQVRTTLATSFPNHTVHDSIVGDGYYAELDEEGDSALADISVMTPERCFMLLDLYPEAFRDVGLFVLDECHILHPSRGPEDRRAIDAMLCLLRLIDAAQQTDVLLLSAMMANSDELAAWIEQVLQRPCLSLALEWKPTRQARGALVFKQADLDALVENVRAVRRTGKTIGPPAALKRSLALAPYGLFCLQHNWATESVAHYRSCLLSSSLLQIDCNARWQLSTAKNNAAAMLATAFARLGTKTIVFSQNKDHCHSIAQRIDNLLAAESATVAPTNAETELSELAIEEAGGESHTYLPYSHGVVCHHSLLNPVEREIAERVFRRRNGANVIVATPTLAQGMNLPAQVVIIAGAGRFDQAKGRSELLAAHEVLNAAGRAGRAGHRAEGIVIVIPDNPIGANLDEGKIGSDWFELRKSIFGQTDQCLTINDPVELMLDRLDLEGAEAQGTPLYFLNRIPVDVDENGTPSDDVARRVLHRSLGYFRAQRDGEPNSFEAKLGGALQLRKRILLDPQAVGWLDRIAGANGVSVRVISSLHDLLVAQSDVANHDVVGWMTLLLEWLAQNPAISIRVLDGDALKQVLGEQAGRDHGDTPHAHAAVIAELQPAMELWVGGAPLADIERACPIKRSRRAASASPTPNDLGKCKKARILSQRLALDLSVLLGLLPQIWRSHQEQMGQSEIDVPIAMATASACVRRGFSLPEHLAVASNLRSIEGFPGQTTRRQVHEFYERIGPHISTGTATETFAEVKTRVDAAIIDSLNDE